MVRHISFFWIIRKNHFKSQKSPKGGVRYSPLSPLIWACWLVLYMFIEYLWKKLRFYIEKKFNWIFKIECYFELGFLNFVFVLFDKIHASKTDFFSKSKVIKINTWESLLKNQHFFLLKKKFIAICILISLFHLEVKD